MSNPKTRQAERDVDSFLDTISDESKREDARWLRNMMEEVAGESARMWGGSIVGCGMYHYRYPSGHEGDTHLVGFSPRARNLTVYVSGGFEGHRALLAKLGNHKLGKGCLYITRLADVDIDTLHKLLAESVCHGCRLMEFKNTG